VRPVYGDPPDSTVVEESTPVADSTAVEYSTVVENVRPDTDDVLAAEGIRGTAADRGESHAGGAARVEHSTVVECIRADTDGASDDELVPLRITS